MSAVDADSWMICSLSVRLNPLGNAVGLGLFDEGVGRLDAPELDLVGEVVRQLILGAVIHPQGHAPALAIQAEVEAYSLASPSSEIG